MEMGGRATWAIEASPRVHELLKRLHTASASQEKSLSFVSLEQDKCQFMYLLARSLGAKNIIEAGTSFGQNVRDARVMGMSATVSFIPQFVVYPCFTHQTPGLRILFLFLPFRFTPPVYAARRQG
ncbi:S-adenosylmethionine-dependent methyltransferase family protein [Metarhizium robertsii]|uniref:S-adenosylmethionine-dependent methyltransferase family protein n=1 Tax=Metarhizium robertsii TaxID=568076 RepID=A0A014MWQ7_9HYPO|nr:S-adenosylmethionine-dependent methyltransferase family protein [Metarhizium robertsii]